MDSEQLPQLEAGAQPAWKDGGGSLKGIKTSPTTQILGYIIQTAEMFSCCHQQNYPLPPGSRSNQYNLHIKIASQSWICCFLDFHLQFVMLFSSTSLQVYKKGTITI